jgi:hypothetical protein
MSLCIVFITTPSCERLRLSSAEWRSAALSRLPLPSALGTAAMILDNAVALGMTPRAFGKSVADGKTPRSTGTPRRLISRSIWNGRALRRRQNTTCKVRASCGLPPPSHAACDTLCAGTHSHVLLQIPRGRHRMRPSERFLLVALLLASCAPLAAPSPIQTPTPAPAATKAPTPKPTLTPSRTSLPPQGDALLRRQQIRRTQFWLSRRSAQSTV